MWPFKKKIKPQRHILRDVGKLPSYYEANRAVRCEKCGKTYVMDMFGGWSIEWDFKPDKDGWYVDKEEIERAVKHKYSLHTYQWFQIDQDVCYGPKTEQSEPDKEV